MLTAKTNQNLVSNPFDLASGERMQLAGLENIPERPLVSLEDHDGEPRVYIEAEELGEVATKGLDKKKCTKWRCLLFALVGFTG
jgi:hypothetical protein